MVDETTGVTTVAEEPASATTSKLLHRTIDAVCTDFEALRFNTAIARITELSNHLTAAASEGQVITRDVAEPLVLLLAPLAPHIAEDLWARLGHAASLAYEPFPEADPARLQEDVVEIGISVNGKARGRVAVPVGADDATHEALAAAAVAGQLAAKAVRKVVVVPGRLVNFVVA